MFDRLGQACAAASPSWRPPKQARNSPLVGRPTAFHVGTLSSAQFGRDISELFPVYAGFQFPDPIGKSGIPNPKWEISCRIEGPRLGVKRCHTGAADEGGLIQAADRLGRLSGPGDSAPALG